MFGISLRWKVSFKSEDKTALRPLVLRSVMALFPAPRGSVPGNRFHLATDALAATQLCASVSVGSCHYVWLGCLKYYNLTLEITCCFAEAGVISNKSTTKDNFCFFQT